MIRKLWSSFQLAHNPRSLKICFYLFPFVHISPKLFMYYRMYPEGNPCLFIAFCHCLSSFPWSFSRLHKVGIFRALLRTCIMNRRQKNVKQSSLFLLQNGFPPYFQTHDKPSRRYHMFLRDRIWQYHILTTFSPPLVVVHPLPQCRSPK